MYNQNHGILVNESQTETINKMVKQGETGFLLLALITTIVFLTIVSTSVFSQGQNGIQKTLVDTAPSYILFQHSQR